jgi:hypothetical protein
MKFIKSFVVVTLLLVSFASKSDGAYIQNGFLTGNTFRALDDSSKKMYVIGLINGMFLAPMYGGSEEKVNSLASCTVGMNGQQLVAIFEKYLNNNPKRWNQSMHVIGYSAMLGACK